MIIFCHYKSAGVGSELEMVRNIVVKVYIAIAALLVLALNAFTGLQLWRQETEV